MTPEAIRYEVRDSVAVITLDDGKANAFSPTVVRHFHEALDRAEKEASAVLVVGRDKRLSAGFDLSVMMKSPEDMRGLVREGAELLLRLYLFPRPVVVACTGHALALGALLLLSADRRIGAEGDFKIGLNEVSIQMPLPIFGVELARDRLSKRHFSAAVTQSTIFSPDGAVDAGYLDRVVAPEQLLETALAEAVRLGGLTNPAFLLTKERERGGTVRLIRETLADDIAALTGPSRG